MIYLDYNATTPIDNEVAEAMLPFIYGNYGNPSSSHELGIEAKRAVENARVQISKLINCSPQEIIFTSGGSESNNTVLKSVAFSEKNIGNHIITSKIEHPSILNPCKYLEKIGNKISYLPVDSDGIVVLKALEDLIDDKTILVTIMHANNETGALQPIKEISEICKKRGVLLHTDACQSVGKILVDVKSLGVDYLSLAGHKLYGPKGIGILYVKEGSPFEPLIHGANHESGRRAGTENIILDVALGKACEIAMKELKNDHIKELTNYFYQKLKLVFDDKLVLNGHPTKKLPNTLNVSFLDYEGQQILKILTGVATSKGSACHSGIVTGSPVLIAMNLSSQRIKGAVRFSLGRYTSKEEIDSVITKLKNLK